MSLHLFYKDDKWLGIVNMASKIFSWGEANDIAIPILNPEELKGVSYLELENNLGYTFYQWPGEYEVNEYCRGSCATHGDCIWPDSCKAVKQIKLLNESIKK